MAARSGPRHDRTLAVAASALAHGVFVAVLLWSLRLTPERREAPVIEVQLVRRPSPPPRSSRPSPKPGHAAPAPHLAPPAPTDVAQPAPAPPLVLEPHPADGLAPALRARLRCSQAALLRLSAEERRRCEDQFATAGSGWRGGAALDLSRAGAIHDRDPEPYLGRRPKNGCKVRAGGDQTPSGQQGAATGVACAWAF